MIVSLHLKLNSKNVHEVYSKNTRTNAITADRHTIKFQIVNRCIRRESVDILNEVRSRYFVRV